MSDDDRDDREPEPTDFSNLLGPEPEWLTCRCGVQTARVPCWDCSRYADRRAQDAEQRNLALASIPPHYAWARLGTSELAKRVQAKEPLETLAKRILASERVVFAGPSGAGKTSFAIACLRERAPYGIFVSAMDLASARIQSRAGDGEAPTVDLAKRAPLVLIDEVGGEEKTSTNAVKPVIWKRLDNDLPTWITTGFNRSELLAMYGDGGLRRLTENATIIQLGAKT